jgi:hypothetical protein
MLIPIEKASDYIGKINPGVGYQWTTISNHMYLVIPDRPTKDAFWPIFILTVAILSAIIIIIQRTRQNHVIH